MDKCLQFNPSTGTLNFYATSSLVMFIEPKVYGPCCQCPPDADTPQYMTLVIQGVTSCPGKNGANVNGTWYLELDPLQCDAGEGELSCRWTYTDAGNVFLRIGFIDSYVFEVAGYVWDSDFNSWRSAFAGSCQAQTCAAILCNGTDSDILEYQCGSTRYGWGGRASWVIGKRPIPSTDAWELGTSYWVDKLVENDDEKYTCIKAHTSIASNEPGTGAEWETYWEIGGCIW